VIVDTSVWIEFFRGTGSGAHRALEDRIRTGAPIVVPDVVLSEVLVGTTDEAAAARLEQTLVQFEIAPVAPVADARSAAQIHRACRRQGEMVRNLGDCYVAAAALRLQLPILHRDRDFEVMARIVGVATVSMLDL
jgi:predicted nucleic acid-binding protein